MVLIKDKYFLFKGRINKEIFFFFRGHGCLAHLILYGAKSDLILKVLISPQVRKMYDKIV